MIFVELWKGACAGMTHAPTAKRSLRCSLRKCKNILLRQRIREDCEHSRKNLESGTRVGGRGAHALDESPRVYSGNYKVFTRRQLCST
ncbi:hypothetical protein EVAR_9311_1 [Eumeta japonica]|uniref:Uncharacterized protein n=1 Tax=Eumeta variegata TaxID=151549 RepID=A0A4C1TN22_EUMVA|nr:hypothetical protein EVAR_9311_1 [Eumeta japonica]